MAPSHRADVPSGPGDLIEGPELSRMGPEVEAVAHGTGGVPNDRFGSGVKAVLHTTPAPVAAPTWRPALTTTTALVWDHCERS